MNKIVLSKESNENEIKRYFNGVLKLSKSDNEFPVNLDEVWPLVYPRKDHAVRELKENFIEGIDYQVSPKNGENPNGGRPIDEYYLTVPCLEFFIARKVRPVFDVYRRVFHKAAEQTTTLSDKMKAATWLIKTLNLNECSKLRLAKTIADPLGLPTPDYTESKDQLLSATELLKKSGSSMSAQVFNAKLIEKGYLTILQRQSSKGVKKFKSLTGKGLEFGENQVNPNNPKETQALYYTSEFPRLLNEVLS